MDKAKCMINGKVRVVTAEEVSAGIINKNDIKECWCPDCNAKAHFDKGTIYPRRRSHFCATHTEGCPALKGRPKVKKKKIVRDVYYIGINELLNHEDKDPDEGGGPKKPPKPVNPPKALGGETEDDQDFLGYLGDKKIRNLRDIYLSIKEAKDEILFKEEKLTGRDILLDAPALRKTRSAEEDIHGYKMAIVKRISPNKLRHSIPIPEGYTLMVDAFTDAANLEDAFLFLVRLKNDKQNDRFRSLVMGGKDSLRDPHNSVLIMGDWVVVPNTFYRLCSSEITTWCYKFIDL